jgi:broad specificity phosphatase PhoE
MFRAIACLVALFFAFAAAPLAGAQTPPTVIIVVRHAEKAAVEGNDPPLSEAGARRAQRLAALAEEAGVSVVYTTQFKRTRETGQAVADRLKIPLVAVEATRDNMATYADSLAREILSKHKGQTVLVVGHSNTAPQVAGALGRKSLAPLDDATDFETLFVVIVPEAGAPRLVRAKY